MDLENTTLGELSRRVERENQRKRLAETAAYRQRINELADEVIGVVRACRDRPSGRVQVSRYFGGKA